MDLVFGVSIIIQNCFSVHSLSFLFLSSVLSSVVLAVCVKCLYKFFCKRETSREIPSKVISARERGSDGEWTRERVMTVSSETRHCLNDLFVDGSKQFPSLLTTCLVLKEILSVSLAPFCQAKLNQMRNYHATESSGKTEKMKRREWLTQKCHSTTTGCRWMNSSLKINYHI